MVAHEEERRQRLLAELEALPDEAMVPALVRSGLRPPAHLLERLTEYVAGRGFDPARLQSVDPQVVSFEWEGRVLRLGDRLSVLEQHFLKHAVARREWPEGTTVTEYVQTGEAVVRDGASGILAAEVRGRWRLSFVGRVVEDRQHSGSDWVVVQYSVSGAHWWSVHRLWRGPSQVARLPGQGECWWLRSFRESGP